MDVVEAFNDLVRAGSRGGLALDVLNDIFLDALDEFASMRSDWEVESLIKDFEYFKNNLITEGEIEEMIKWRFYVARKLKLRMRVL